MEDYVIFMDWEGLIVLRCLTIKILSKLTNRYIMIVSGNYTCGRFFKNQKSIDSKTYMEMQKT